MEFEKLLDLERKIDECIEKEDFELLNKLLDEREKFINSKLPKEVLKLIYEKDQIRKKKIKKIIDKLKVQAKDLKAGEKALKGYGNIFGLENEGGRFKGKG
ncbi:RNA-binding protein [Thermosipho affectus]|uniref:RNA-binding protein n=1 Tax=Thermosipho affectus TaxID=660294 RepID=A0ABX3IKM2_9BACT|nr:RNA-binding protein [Thermosipho affectus]ONN27955.1 RNA-binding protein [Thermosipho affectus]